MYLNNIMLSYVTVLHMKDICRLFATYVGHVKPGVMGVACWSLAQDVDADIWQHHV